MKPYAAVEESVATINDLLNVLNVLTWDSRVNMAASGAEARAQHLATLSAIAHEKLLDPTLKENVVAAQRELGDRVTLAQERTLNAVSEAIAYHGAVPKKLNMQLAHAKGTAQQAWVTARQNGDFSTFAPHLQQMLQLKRELTTHIEAGRAPYDALMHEYEPHMTTKTLLDLFGKLKRTLVPLAAAIREKPVPRTDFLFRTFDPAKQRKFALMIAEKFGYDTSRGRADTAPHPFEISFTRDDVRITTRYNPNYLPGSLFALWHEAGHGMYEQGASPLYTRSALTSDLLGLYAVAGTSYGTHESQSRLWENLVGRARPFWEVHYEQLRDLFPSELNDVTLLEFYRAVNTVKSTPIRVEADEVTYHLHIMLRVELELGLLDESITVEELPGVWKEKMQDYLGLEVIDDRDGVLQDIHWSAGLFGAFPTYTIGTVMASQFFAAAIQQDPDIEKQLHGGQYGALHQWLTNNIYQHARLCSPDELLVSTTGRSLDISDYEQYVTNKYAELYG